ncbi:MAG: hypothetical protein NT132_09990 [Microbacterium sp.]|uniref:DUF6611 family protein n=1 Tax=Microbacterium sp. TaxID=51671 RepID=UPI00260FFC45|nr:DUF6611 family protein [Microbacterium sp.]MCX6502714.1 hypothetical protein [Microbacterium sp.]
MIRASRGGDPFFTGTMSATVKDRLQGALLGDHPWGQLRTTGGAHGVWVWSLTVYPPGTTTRERWALAADRFAPALGAVVGLSACAFVANSVIWLAGLSIVLGGLLFTSASHRFTRRLRRGVRTLHVSVDVRSDPPTIAGDVELLNAIYLELTRLDGDSALEPVAYEQRWGFAYERMPSSAAARGPRFGTVSREG